MDPQSPVPPHSIEPVPATEPPRRRISRRATLLGSLIAVVVVGGVGWLAWELTHPDAPAVAGAGPRGGAGGGGSGGGGPAGGAAARGPATTVGIAAAERADIPIVIDALGTVVPQATVRVRPQVSGVLQQLLFKEGQMVRKGDLLAQIDPRQFEMTLQQAAGQRMRDEAQLEAARVTLERYRTLLQQDSIARQDVDTQAALVKQLEGTVVSDKANEGTARLNLGYTRIVAPVAGRVGLRTVDIGNVVSTSDANGVALITQLSPIDVEFAIPQDQAPELQRNAGAFMERRRSTARAPLSWTPVYLGRWTTRSIPRPGPCAPRPASTTQSWRCFPASSSMCSSMCAPSTTPWWFRFRRCVKAARASMSSCSGKTAPWRSGRCGAARRRSTRSRSPAGCRWVSA
jgi:multidrug efflux system membrane fusion protein